MEGEKADEARKKISRTANKLLRAKTPKGDKDNTDIVTSAAAPIDQPPLVGDENVEAS